MEMQSKTCPLLNRLRDKMSRKITIKFVFARFGGV